MTTQQPRLGIPQVPQSTDQETHRFLGALKEQVEVTQGVRGDYKARGVTLGMLISAGIITDTQAQQLARG